MKIEWMRVVVLLAPRQSRELACFELAWRLHLLIGLPSPALRLFKDFKIDAGYPMASRFIYTEIASS